MRRKALKASDLDKPVKLEVCSAHGRVCCAYLNDFRVAGSKPWGGGTTVHEWTTTLREVIRAFKPLQDALGFDYLGQSPEDIANRAKAGEP